MPSYQTLGYRLEEGVLTLTMNRPEVYNALNEQMRKDLTEAFREAEKDPSVRCIVLRGAGDRAFCSGQDLKEQGSRNEPLKDVLERSYNPMIRKIRSIEKPVIAMINGVAAGAGCSLALACDMRIMSGTATLIEVFIRIGLVPDSGSSWFLPRLAGMARAFEYMATGRDITAEEAERAGLVNKVVGPGELENVTMEIARGLAGAPTKAIGLAKRALNKALGGDLDSCLAYEAYIQQIASGTEDHKEGLRAFLEKRKASFRGR